MENKYQKTRFSLLGQCCFTYNVLRNLVKADLAPECVLIEASEVDHDPFKGLNLENQQWFNEHKLYHRDWIVEMDELCRQHSIRLEICPNVIDKLVVQDTLVVAGYARKVPTDILMKYNGWAINIHPSILPMFKGPQPEAHMILHENYNYAGVTIHEMTTDWDSGRIYWQNKLEMDDSLTVGKMEAIEADIASTGLKELFMTFPAFGQHSSFDVQTESYQSWYDSAILDLDLKCPDKESCSRLLRLRPEGYAQIITDDGLLYPISEFVDACKKGLFDGITGGVLKSKGKIEYLSKGETVKIMKESCL